jgi:hypothetical protein
MNKLYNTLSMLTLEEFYYEVCPDKVLAEYDFKNNVWNYNSTGIFQYHTKII